MKKNILLTVLLSFAVLIPSLHAEEGFTNMFDGSDLAGWDGVTNFWSVRDGAIVGQTTAENPAHENTFLVWTNGQPGDFELRCQFRIKANNSVGFANSGIQYRSKVVKPSYFVVAGYQADMEAGPNYTGGLYEEKGRGVLAKRGQRVVIEPDGKISVKGETGNFKKLEDQIRKGDWNDYTVIARGNHLEQFINGKKMVDVIDNQAAKAASSGVIALQLHAGQPMTVEFKDLRIKE